MFVSQNKHLLAPSMYDTFFLGCRQATRICVFLAKQREPRSLLETVTQQLHIITLLQQCPKYIVWTRCCSKIKSDDITATVTKVMWYRVHYGISVGCTYKIIPFQYSFTFYICLIRFRGIKQNNFPTLGSNTEARFGFMLYLLWTISLFKVDLH